MPATFDPAAILRPTMIKPYPYQEEGVRAIIREFKSGTESTLATFPTGTGKGFIMAWCSKWAIKNGMRALTLAHTAELVLQNANYHEDLGVPTSIEMADQHARSQGALSWMPSVYAEGSELLSDPVSVSASKATLQGERLKTWPRDYFGLINCDEAHHSVSDSYQQIFNWFKGAKRLLVTATPDRLDGQDMGNVAQTIAHQYPMRKAIEDGWLCRPKFIRCTTQIDLRKFTKRKMADFSESDIAEAIRPHIEDLANAIRAEIGDRRTIVFCPDILTSDFMASALQSLGLKAEVVSGKTKNRDEIIGGFKSGDFQVLCNAMLLTEGFNMPECSAVAICRPTMSRGLYSQMIGRCLRRGKPTALIIDFTWVTSGDSGLPEPDQLFVCPTELFDTYQTPQEVQEIAKKLVEDGETDDILEAVERAEKEYEERVRVRIQVREKKVRYGRIIYDPFAVMEAMGIPIRNEAESSKRVLTTPKQVELLKKFGVQGAETMSKRRGKVVLDGIFDRMHKGLCTPKQICHLVANGVEADAARNMSKQEASEFLSQCFGKN